MTMEMVGIGAIIGVMVFGLVYALRKQNVSLIKFNKELLKVQGEQIEKIGELYIEISEMTPFCNARVTVQGKIVFCHLQKGHEGLHAGHIDWENEDRGEKVNE